VTATEIENAAGTATETPVIVKRSPIGLYSPVIITLIMLAVVRFFQVSGVATANTFFNVFADTKLAVPTAQIGLMVAAARLLGVFAALSTPIVVARWGAPMTVLLAALVSVLFIFPLAFAPHWIVAGIGFVGVISLSSMRYPAYMIFSTAEVPPNWRGTMAGTGEFAGGVTFAVLAFVGGWIAENQGFATLFLIGGAMTLAGTILFYFWFMLARSKRKGVGGAVVEVSSEPLV
jgi:predicted MFS family arabinose efflux permease